VKISRWLIRIFAVVFFAPGLMGGTLYWLHQKGFFNLEHIEVLVDNVELKSHYLRPQAERIEKIIESARGQSLWQIDLSKIKEEIQKLNWVEDVVIVRQWPATLRAKITPFDVKMLLLTKKNEFMPIVKNGEVLPAIDVKNLPDATVLRGEAFQKNIVLRKQAVGLWEDIPSEGSFSRPQISEIFFREKEGFWVTLIRSGIEVRLGQESIPLKSKRVGQVLDYLQNHQFDARVIDADLSQKVLVRLRKDP
jgi:cell division protein FtsQ